jgi:hypothetical protein
VQSFSFLLLLIFIIPANTRAQTRAGSKPDPDRLGMTCAQILAMTSNDWVVYFLKKTNQISMNNASGLLQAIDVYGRCYSARTDALAATIGRNGKGPTKAQRLDFARFEEALKDFTAIAQSAAQPPPDEQYKANAALYAKEFRYKFYRGYETRKTQAAPSLEDFEALGLAKNHFGELLSALPEDKMHGVHAAFGQIFEKNTLAEEWRLEIYRYAISLLEPPSATPFSPPPF